METATAREELLELISHARGDEKHDVSSFSTLDAIQVLYEVMNVDPANPEWEERDRFLLSKGHGPLAYYAVLAHNGFFDGDELTRFMRWDGILGAHPDRCRFPASRSRPARSVTACRWRWASPMRSARAAATRSACSCSRATPS